MDVSWPHMLRFTTPSFQHIIAYFTWQIKRISLVKCCLPMWEVSIVRQWTYQLCMCHVCVSKSKLTCAWLWNDHQTGNLANTHMSSDSLKRSCQMVCVNRNYLLLYPWGSNYHAIPVGKWHVVIVHQPPTNGAISTTFLPVLQLLEKAEITRNHCIHLCSRSCQSLSLLCHYCVAGAMFVSTNPAAPPTGPS
jgi:hypothetical protein